MTPREARNICCKEDLIILFQRSYDGKWALQVRNGTANTVFEKEEFESMSEDIFQQKILELKASIKRKVI